MTTFASIEVKNFDITGLDLLNMAKRCHSANVAKLSKAVKLKLVKRLAFKLNKTLLLKRLAFNGDTEEALDCFKADLNEMLPYQIEFAIRDTEV